MSNGIEVLGRVKVPCVSVVDRKRLTNGTRSGATVVKCVSCKDISCTYGPLSMLLVEVRCLFV